MSENTTTVHAAPLPGGRRRVYLPRKGRARQGRVAHISVSDSLDATECGIYSPWGLWGTGSFEEEQIAESLPLCRRCILRLPEEDAVVVVLGEPDTHNNSR